jgi:heat shock protein HslJ
MNTRLVAVIGVALLAIACSAAGAAPLNLEGRTFLSVDVTVDGVRKPLVPGTRISVSFRDGNLSANAGCNHIGGAYRLDNGRLIVDSMAMTEMGCDPARHAQDEDVSRWLSARPQVRLNGAELVLDGGSVVMRLLDREQADPDRPLAGTRWVLTTIIDGDAAMSVPNGVIATLELTEDGNFSMRACNQGGGRYEVDETAGTIAFSDIMLTRMACDGDRGQVEAAMLAVLEADEVGYSIEAGNLMLDAGAAGLGFSAQPLP